MRLLEGVNPHVRGRVHGLRRLETWLGEEHNLTLLAAALVELSEVELNP
jgi:hypothetical protein